MSSPSFAATPAHNRAKTPIALTIAGSDSGGGAGIQADIKAMSATGSYACSVIAALTAQNTLGVTGVMPVPADFIGEQIDAVFSDIPVDAVKIGMLGDAATIRAVAEGLKRHKPKWVVLDPVMVATSGDLLLATEAVETLIAEMLPLADVITPNLPEALTLLGRRGEAEPEDDAGMQALCQALLEQGARSVLVKGGHQHGQDSVDYWVSPGQSERYTSPRIPTRNTHGTGCTLSASIASYLAQGADMPTAIGQAKAYISKAIAHADELHIGAGHGPVHHFYNLKG